jgi:hypothetical protein
MINLDLGDTLGVEVLDKNLEKWADKMNVKASKKRTYWRLKKSFLYLKSFKMENMAINSTR